MPSSTIVLGAIVAAAMVMSLAACQRNTTAAPLTTDTGTGTGTGTTIPANTPIATTPAAPVAINREPTLPAPPLPEGTEVTYHCQDGNQLTVTYTYITANLRWPDGRAVKLSRAASASKGGGDVYVGGKVSLQHDGGSIQLQDGATTTTCSESEATA
jgi:membrane-bound inhibitor of C-type lysozyme